MLTNEVKVYGVIPAGQFFNTCAGNMKIVFVGITSLNLLQRPNSLK